MIYATPGLTGLVMTPMFATNSSPRLHVTANLPPEISFSSVEEPQLQVRMTLEYSQPIMIVLQRSRLWPHRLHSALTLHNVSSGQQEYLPRVDAPLRDPPIPPLDAEHRESFVGLTPGQTSVVTVSFRPYSEPYDYDKMKKDGGMARYKMLFPIGMQFLTVGEVYEVGVQGGCTEEYMVGDMDDVVGEEGKSVEWTPASDLVQVVPGEKCRFRVTA